MVNLPWKSGWTSDPSESKYYKEDKEEVIKLLKLACDSKKSQERYTIEKAAIENEENCFDLSNFFTDVENQAPLESCTAFAVVGILEYFQKRAFSGANIVDLSPLFLYQKAKQWMREEGINRPGVSFVATLNAFLKYGIAPENIWPYKEDNFYIDPNDYVLKIAKGKGSFYTQNHGIKFFRIDPAIDRDAKTGNEKELLKLIKKYLQAGFPLAFGFQTSDSCLLQTGEKKGNIPFPTDIERESANLMTRRHAVIAVGYDDTLEITNYETGKTTKGALKIRNSWSQEKWGNKGYGYLPYEYVYQKLTRDWWTFIQDQWAKTGEFGLASAEGDEWWGDTITSLQPRNV